MSLQEAASSGAFGARPPQPAEPQPADSPFAGPMADDDASRAEAQAASPFANPYVIPPGDAGAPLDADHDDMRAKRRRAWTVVSLAIVVPAAIAGIVAWQLFGGDAAPTPTVTRVSTPAAETEPVDAPSAVVSPPTPAATDGTPAVTATTTVTAVTTSDVSGTDAAAPAVTTADTTTEPAQTVDLSTLEPAARLAAWPDIERIQVASGESLWLLAYTYETTVSAIATLNGITDLESLSVGQELAIPVGFGEEIVATATATEGDGGDAAAPTAPTSGSFEDLDSWSNIAVVTVEDGDSLDAIARANGTSIQAIMALNGLTDSNLIFVGDALRVPVGYQGEVPGVELNTQQTVTDVQASRQTETTDGTAAASDEDDMLAEDDEAQTGGASDGDNDSDAYSMSE